MFRKLKFCLPIAVLLIAALACQFQPEQSDAQAAITSGNVLFQDDFTKPASGWTTWKQDVSEAYYQDGQFHIVINEPHYDYWSRPGKRFTDTQIEVDALKVSGPDDNDFGILCRYRNADNFYGFFYTSDGYYGIVRIEDGKYQVISSDQMQYSEEIARGNAANHLRGDCVGNVLTLYVNGKRLAEARDDHFKSGEVGLLAGSYDKPDVHIQFDNFTVLKP